MYSGDLVDAIGFHCSDGTTVNRIGGMGGLLTKKVTSYKDKGFDRLLMRTGDSVDSIVISEVDRINGIEHKFGG